ncbi:MAG: phosphodiester glycosidase family protein [Longimicrobiales bacterium]|nr:phosphodiester glycosidase family protein [Longimicrobiales bacterium]
MVALAAGCAAPDAPDALELTLPATAMALLVPDSVRTVELHSGVTYRYLWSPEGPWAIHVVQADLRARCDLELGVLRPDVRQRGGNGHATVSDMVLRVSDRVLVAVNADFFTPEGTTLGAEVVGGDVQYAAERPTVAWRLGLDPWIGPASIDAAGLHLGWLVGAVAGDGVTEAVGGFPDLIDRGEIVGDLEVGRRPAFAAVRHPRTGVGFDSRSGQFWIVVVDGRQMPHSAGMSLPEFAALFDALGADEALNLDGGGSSAMVVGQGLVNRPSDATGERAVVNALALTQNPHGCAAGQARP